MASKNINELIAEWERDPELRADLEEGREWLREWKRSNYAALVNPVPDARFDDVFFNGLKWLDEQ